MKKTSESFLRIEIKKWGIKEDSKEGAECSYKKATIKAAGKFSFLPKDFIECVPVYVFAYGGHWLSLSFSLHFHILFICSVEAMYGSQRTTYGSWWSPSTMWVPGLKCR